MRGVRGFVEGLLRQRRAGRVRSDPEHDAELRTAILLRSARPGAGAPTEEFVSQLHRRLSAELGRGEVDAEAAPVPVTPRRGVVRVASVAAAAAVVGAGLDHVLAAPREVPQETQPTQPTLSPDQGVWRTVVATADLPEGAVVPFDIGVVNGFVRRSGGQVRAVSGVCTHLGCRLALNRPDRSLDCPCHRASFALDGTVLHHELRIELAALPMFRTREVGGRVQVFVPGA